MTSVMHAFAEVWLFHCFYLTNIWSQSPVI